MWLKLDDEKTSLHTEEEVKRTAGGADGPIAYVCIYGAILCPFFSFFFLLIALASAGVFWWSRGFVSAAICVGSVQLLERPAAKPVGNLAAGFS